MNKENDSEEKEYLKQFSNKIRLLIASNYFKAVLFLIVLYLFLFSINLLSHSFKLFGKGFAEALLTTTSNPFIGLMIGIFATSLIQSSSTTTSIVVGLVAAGTVNLQNAIPIIMGANIGTTVTNTIVSIGHIGNRIEFRRAFAGSTVHDIFNILAVIVLFPLEYFFHIIEKTALVFEKLFVNIGGAKLFNPLKYIIKPLIKVVDSWVEGLPHPEIILAILAIMLLFFSLVYIVKLMKSMVMKKIEAFMDKYLFKNTLTSFTLGLLFTATVQSSSATTSIVVPLVGAGILNINQIFPYTLGANIGTTVTAILAALATSNTVAITVAFSHLVFNILGICIFLPLRRIPITLALKISYFAAKSKKHTILTIMIYFTIFLIPLVIIIFFN